MTRQQIGGCRKRRELMEADRSARDSSKFATFFPSRASRQSEVSSSQFPLQITRRGVAGRNEEGGGKKKDARLEQWVRPRRVFHG